ncbi:MAG: MarR family winged helix-turn-helix transcriptional regulator [Acidimicrobiales bacterium]|nr:MarR family winged helix-turn-helix transcriptional regulator [Acidimicrobiales bacterium]
MDTPTPREQRLKAELDIEARLRDARRDFPSMHAIANIYRAAAEVRRNAERDVLAMENLSWGGFTILWVLWIWGSMETNLLATECDLAKGTLTGMLGTLGKRGLIERARMDRDRRRVIVSLTPTGVSTIERVAPAFNDFEAKMTVCLDDGQKNSLSELLRVVIHNANGER